ncbi:hypothetical protein LOK80_00090 [Xylella fastidiosa subsp. multiplex]|uniref:hypothetical protein n=1 Tax=Xylella fastidiosa TaxID=2371 RepID=UPI00234D8606|nr:hypothetical protein [Xylella fastidiosa]MDC6409715.1 hypothetical protein [Xylella fastidiosa subsp. multiplex]
MSTPSITNHGFFHTKDTDALTEMRSRYQLASDYCRDLYDQSRDDITFVTVPGSQWDPEHKRRRKTGHRMNFLNCAYIRSKLLMKCASNALRPKCAA